MQIEIEILNTEKAKEGEENFATWHSRWKSYKSDWLDDDMKQCTVSHKVGRVILNDVQLATKAGVEDLIEFLTNAKESFDY